MLLGVFDQTQALINHVLASDRAGQQVISLLAQNSLAAVAQQQQLSAQQQQQLLAYPSRGHKNYPAALPSGFAAAASQTNYSTYDALQQQQQQQQHQQQQQLPQLMPPSPAGPSQMLSLYTPGAAQAAIGVSQQSLAVLQRMTPEQLRAMGIGGGGRG